VTVTKCPVCHGDGLIRVDVYKTMVTKIESCTVCNGTGKITVKKEE